MAIRDADIHDALFIYNLGENEFAKYNGIAEGGKTVLRCAASKGSIVLIFESELADKDDCPMPLGFCITEWIDVHAYLCAIAIHPRCRRQGIGRELLRESFRRILQKSGGQETLVKLNVAPSNISAIALFEAEGFEKRNACTGLYKQTREPALVMIKNLKLD